ncbi:MAG: glycoside hydrolase family 66 protein [Mucilaginibacter sp.]
MKKLNTAIYAVLLLCSFGCLKEKIKDNTGAVTKINDTVGNSGSVKVNMTIDKAAYNPGETVTFTIDQSLPATAKVRYKQAGTIVQNGIVNGKSWTWATPSNDFTGYMVELFDTVKSKEVIYGAIGVDVSSDPAHFPRNGFLSAYGALSTTDMNATMATLNRYHINYIQFQDWEYEHSMPLAGTPASPDPSWKDIANRDNYMKTVQGYIALSQGYNMKTLSYNLCYGALSDAASEGISDTWYLYNDASHNKKNESDLPMPPFKSNLYILDPSNTGWQNFLAGKTQDVFQVYNFDGWQIDQLGDRGTVYNYSGSQVDVSSTFNPFITAMRAALPQKRMVMNAVNKYGQAGIAKAPVDFLYTEVWSPNENFSDLGTILQSNDAQTNGAKRSVLAAYMDYNLANNPGFFNAPGVILTDAVIFAFGGSHLELGEHMLGKEYFPNANLTMPDDLKTAMVSYYDFLTGYENLLRDGGIINSPSVLSSDGKTKLNNWPPQQGQVSVIGRDLGNKQVIHLLNFTNANSLLWRDADGKQVKPVTIASPGFSLSTTKTVKSVWMASPDLNNGASQPLSFKQSGGSVTFTLPSLQYWDMVVVEYQ